MNFLRRSAFLGVLLALSLVALIPLHALAGKQITDRYWDDSDGDPIDGNDFSSGGGGGSDDIFHQDSAGDSGLDGRFIVVMPVPLSGARIVVLPTFESGIFMVRLSVINSSPVALEEDHVR